MGVLPQDTNALGWGGAAVKAQIGEAVDDAKELVSGGSDADDKANHSADEMAKGKALPSKGKSFGK